MAIQWYPGHMHKASKEMKAILPTVDLIIEVLDARIPYSSENPMLAELRGDKPVIKVLNKMDLADPEKLNIWQAYLEQKKNVKTFPMVAQQTTRVSDLLDLCVKMVPNKASDVKNIQTMIMGIPNVGKSTLINSLAGRIIAKTGNEPAITKRQQRIKLDRGIVLHDTPGVLWPNLENPHSGYRLAVSGAIKETAIENADIALYAVEYLLQTYPGRLAERYQIEENLDAPIETLEAIGRLRGCLSGGGHIDYDRVAKIVLTELRAGTLGRLILEMPQQVEQEWAQVLVTREEKAAKKAARKQRRKR
jgi:ribosome biogenesis GTPase A